MTLLWGILEVIYLKTKRECYGRLSVEEIIIGKLDEVRTIETYRYLSEEERREWRIFIVRTVMVIRRHTSRIMALLDLLTFILIGSALYSTYINAKYMLNRCIIAFVAIMIDILMKIIMDRIERRSIQKAFWRREMNTLREHSAR